MTPTLKPPALDIHLTHVQQVIEAIYLIGGGLPVPAVIAGPLAPDLIWCDILWADCEDEKAYLQIVLKESRRELSVRLDTITWIMVGTYAEHFWRYCSVQNIIKNIVTRGQQVLSRPNPLFTDFLADRVPPNIPLLRELGRQLLASPRWLPELTQADFSGTPDRIKGVLLNEDKIFPAH